MVSTFLEAFSLKKTVIICVLLAVLSGCSGGGDFESVMDTQPVFVDAPMRTVLLELPEEAALEVFENAGTGKLYLCADYEIAVQVLEGGDLERTLREITGFPKERLTLIETEWEGMRRYTCAWSAAGEEEQRIGRAVILDDGNWHYTVCVMADASKAAELQERWNVLLNSFSLANTAQ